MKNLTRSKTLIVALFAAGALLAGGATLAHDKQAHATGKSGRVPVPVLTITQGEKCVEPTEEMRRNHMEKILHQRDETMHRGIRTTQHSLKNCVNCHADPRTNSVLGKDGFCESCHRYAAVNIDCFSCHTAEREARDGEPTTSANTARALKATATGDKKP